MEELRRKVASQTEDAAVERAVLRAALVETVKGLPVHVGATPPTTTTRDWRRKRKRRKRGEKEQRREENEEEEEEGRWLRMPVDVWKLFGSRNIDSGVARGEKLFFTIKGNKEEGMRNGLVILVEGNGKCIVYPTHRRKTVSRLRE